MEHFERLTGHAAPLMENDIDTDAIFPARYLMVMEKAGLGRYLFHDRRGDAHGQTFVLDRPQYAGAQILISATNFGCGSSREQAVWAIAGAGFRCVIAHSFGDIFYANCFKNGVLPIVLPLDEVERLGALAQAGAQFDIDLTAQTLSVEGRVLAFHVAPQRREALLNGRDDVDEILTASGSAITAFEARSRATQPWLFIGDALAGVPQAQ